MVEAGYLIEVIAVLIAAVLFTLLFYRLGMGMVLGYLVAGTVIGPSGLALVTGGETIRALADLGVVFLLFTVGLELPYERIKLLFGRIFALGAAQVLLSALAIGGVAYGLGVGLAAASVIGAGLALSSTAIVLRMLSDRGELTTHFGRTVFGVLLVQDLAVAPFLVWVLALGQQDLTLPAAVGFALIKMLTAVVVILGIGRYLLRHVLWQVATLREPEIFAALTLFIALGTGLLAQLAGLSLAFGAFLAGMLLAGTNYRHQVASVIQPFRGLLLGLFFMTVGMQVDLAMTLREAGPIALLVAGLLLGKALLLVPLAGMLGVAGGKAMHLGILLSQGGEFAFVLLGAGMIVGILPAAQGQLLIVVVALTMMATPVLAIVGRWIEHRMDRGDVVPIEVATRATAALRDHVVIAGFGRVGAAVAASLESAGMPFIAIDLDPQRILHGQARGLSVYYGDATRPEILDLVHVERAHAVVVAVDQPRAALQLVAMLHYIFPQLRVYARAHDEAHAKDLERAGAHVVVPELVATGHKLADSLLNPAAISPGGNSPSL